MLRTCLLALLLPLTLTAADGKVTQAEQEAETAWLKSLGVTAPVQAWPLEDPFTQPFTRRSLVVPTAWYRNRPKTIKADLFRQDLPILHTVMQTAYGGWDAAKQRGWNWDKFFQDWDAALAARGTEELSLADAFALWRKFMEVQLDNHSGPIVGGFRDVGHGFSWTAVMSQAPAGACTEIRNATGVVYALSQSDAAQQPKRREDRTGKPLAYIVAPSTKGPVVSVHCGEQWIPTEPVWMPEEESQRAENIRGLAQTAKDVPTFRSISPRISYIRFPSFSKPSVELTKEMEKTLQGKPSAEDLLIVDLRGNGGGDMRIQALGKWSRLPDPESQTRLGQSCLYPALRWGYTQISSSSLKPPVSDSMRRNLQASLNALFHDDSPGCPSRFVVKPAKWNFTDHRYPSQPAGKTRFLVLTDNFCGSDCEGAVLTLAAVPGTVIAGVNTFGVAQFIQPGYFVLPNSRLPFRIALGTADHYGDARSFDGYGIDVDIVLASKEDQSPESILQLAGRLLPPAK